MFVELLFRLLFLALAAFMFSMALAVLFVGVDVEKFIEVFLPIIRYLGAMEPKEKMLAEMRDPAIHAEAVVTSVVYVTVSSAIAFFNALATKGGMSLANRLSIFLNLGMIAVHAKLYLVAKSDERRQELVEHVGMTVLLFVLSLLYFLVSWLGGAGNRTDVRDDATAPFLLRALSALLVAWKPLALLGAVTLHFVSDSLNDFLDMTSTHGGYTPRMYDAKIGDSDTFHLLFLEVTTAMFIVHAIFALNALGSVYGSNARKRTLLLDWGVTLFYVAGVALAHGRYYKVEKYAQQEAANMAHGLRVAQFFLLPSTVVLLVESVWGSSAAAPSKSAPKYKTN